MHWFWFSCQRVNPCLIMWLPTASAQVISFSFGNVSVLVAADLNSEPLHLFLNLSSQRHTLDFFCTIKVEWKWFNIACTISAALWLPRVNRVSFAEEAKSELVKSLPAMSCKLFIWESIKSETTALECFTNRFSAQYKLYLNNLPDLPWSS